jgi:hypothetical protein
MSRAACTAVGLLAVLAGGARAADEGHDLFVLAGDGSPLRLRLHVDAGGRQAAQREKGFLRLDPMPAVAPYGELLTQALVTLLDRDRDGKLSREELRSAVKVLLAECDTDEDECITPFELVPALLTAAPPGRKPGPAPDIVLLHPGQAREDRLSELMAARPGVKYEEAAGWLRRAADGDVTVRLDNPARERIQLRAGGWLIDVGFQKAERPAGVGVPPSDGLGPLVLQNSERPPKGGTPTPAAGVFTLTASTRPRSWFAVLDANDDGQLGVRELRSAWERLADAEARAAGFLSPPDAEAPVLTLTFVPGTAGARGVPLVRRNFPASGPAWFRAMDRNGDGDVSPAEFVGDRDEFRRLDRDGDGLISPEEAEAATPRP